MQKIFLEKSIDLNNELKELMALSVDESINYKMENEGIRAVGSLLIRGEYKSGDLKEFEESLDLDVLATFDKIIDQRDFSIKVEDFDYQVRDGNLYVKVEAGVHGVIQGEDRYVEDGLSESLVEDVESLIRDEFEQISSNQQSEEFAREIMEDFEPMIEDQIPLIDSDLFDETDFVLDKQELGDVLNENSSDELKEVVYESKTRPMFKDYNDSVGTYYLYIIKEDDTYDSVATYYNVTKDCLMEYNQNKTLQPGLVIIVPYVA